MDAQGPPPSSSSSALSAVPAWDEPVGYVIKFPRSDGLPSRRPTKLDPTPKGGIVDYMMPLTQDHQKSLHWRMAIGKHIAEHVMKRTDLNSPWIIEDFPENYVLYDHMKGNPNADLRHDIYLFGSRNVEKFRSPNEFYLHAQWLFLNEDPSAVLCPCKWCSKSKDQSSINQMYGLGGAFRGSISPKVSRTRARPPKPSTGGVTKKAQRGRKSVPGPSTSRISTGVVPSSEPAARSPPSPSMPSPPRTPSPLRPHEAVNHLRQNDIRMSHKARSRQGEIVWCRVNPPFQGAEPWQRIDLWPGIVEEHVFMLRPVPYQFGVQRPQPDRVDACRVHLLGVTQKMTFPEADITPYLAYDVPKVLDDWMEHQLSPGMSVSSDLSELATFRPCMEPTVASTLQSPTEPRSFGEAWPSYVLAVNIARDIRCSWHTTDPFSPNPTYTSPMLSTPANTNTNDNEREESPMEPKSLYQGIWWGSERIWQDDLVRLKMSRAQLEKGPPANNNASLEDPVDPGEPPLFMRIDLLWTEFVDSQALTYIGGNVFELRPVPEDAVPNNEAIDDVGMSNGSNGSPTATRPLRQLPLLSAPPFTPNGPPPPPGFTYSSILEPGKQLELSLAGLAGRYYPYLLDTPLNSVLSDPERNSVQPQMLQSLAGRLNGAVRAMGVKMLAYGRAPAVEESGRARKAELAERWGLTTASNPKEVVPMDVEPLQTGTNPELVEQVMF